MGYQESNFDLCKQCWIEIKKPSKKAIKKVVLTTYKGKCENCSKIDRLVDCVWEKEEDEND